MKKQMKFLLLVLMLLLSLQGMAGAEEGKILKAGAKGPEVLELNTRLRQLNYTQVRAGEEYSAATVAAVSAVQAAYGLPVTGEADEATLEIIYGVCYRPLNYGDEGKDVMLLQEKLTELGYYWGRASGNYLEGTTAAVQAFQEECGLEVTGSADVFLQEKLFAMSIRPTPSPSPIPTATPVPTPSPTPGPYQPFKRTLAYGTKGEDVRAVQQRLMDLGFFTYPKTTTGYYKNTQAAVEAFQKHNGLLVNGKVDEPTWNALFNDVTTVGAGHEPKPDYVPTPIPYFLEVDVRNQVVKVWKYSRETEEYSDLDRAFLCATGTTTYPSKPGLYTLSGRKSAHCKFPTWGGGEARWWTKIDGEIAFHSVLYSSSSDDSTLKVGSLTGLGRRGSHGCIRLTVADAKWIYDHAEKGMQVWIHEDAQPDPELRYAIQPGKLNRDTMMPYVTPAPPVYPAYDGTKPPETAERSLRVGKEGEDVYWLQMKLKELGFYTGTVTGQYREGTEKAVRAYQRDRGLSADGVAGTRTLNYLYDEVMRANLPPTLPPPPTPIPSPVPTQVPPPTEVPAYRPDPNATHAPVIGTGKVDNGS